MNRVIDIGGIDEFLPSNFPTALMDRKRGTSKKSTDVSSKGFGTYGKEFHPATRIGSTLFGKSQRPWSNSNRAQCRNRFIGDPVRHHSPFDQRISGPTQL